MFGKIVLILSQSNLTKVRYYDILGERGSFDETEGYA